GEGPDHLSNIRAYYEALQSDRPVPLTPESAAEVQKIIDGIHWHGWNHVTAFAEWAASFEPLPRDADEAKAQGWDGGPMWRRLLEIVENPKSGLDAPFL